MRHVTRAWLLSACAVLACADVRAADVRAVFYSPSIVRIVKTPGSGPIPEKRVPVVGARPLDVQPEPRQTPEGRVWRTDRLTVTADARGVVTFAAADGTVLLREKAPAEFPKADYNGRPALRNVQSFVLPDDEPIYGLGDWQDETLNRRGTTRRLMIEYIGNGMPCFCSPRGYLVYWDNTGPVWFRDRVGDALVMESEIGSAVDYYFVWGGSLAGAVKGVRVLTGDAPLFALGCYGYWQCRETYGSQEEIVGALEACRAAGIPVDGMIQDWKYWGPEALWNSMEFTNPAFPDPKAMTDRIHRLHAKLMISVWPDFGPATEPYYEMREKGFLLPFKTFPYECTIGTGAAAKTYPVRARLYDAYSAAAREVYWKYLSRLRDTGVDYWWMDATDMDLRYREGDFEYDTSLGCTLREVLNAYPYLTVKGVSEHLRQTDGEHRPFILTRASFVGQHRFGSQFWSGDIHSTWEHLRRQIPNGLNFSLTGSPFWNCDLGGWNFWRYGDPKLGDPLENRAWRELFVRWIEYGVFLPMMRNHGSGCPREFYRYGKPGEPVYDALLGAVRLRYRLLPYVYSTAWKVCNDGASFLMPVDGRSDAYMFGESIFVQPIVRALYTREDEPTAPRDTDFAAPRPLEVALPQGVWYELAADRRLDGGRSHVLSTTIATIPAFARAGTILPVGPDVQYATERPWDDLEVRVYPGADGTFVLYEDAFDGFGYERGERSEIKFDWDDAARRLTIGARRGSYPGMLARRRFRVRLVGGSEIPVEYDGAGTEVGF